MTDRRGDLLDEAILRRALRLEADERTPIFDPAAIAAAAGQRPRIALLTLVALGFVGIGAVAAWSAIAILLPAVLANAFDLGLALLALVAVPASAIAGVVQQPVVPLSLLAALAIATAYELRERSLSVANVR